MLLERLQRPIRGVRIVRKDPQPDDPSAIGAQIIPSRRLSPDEVERVIEQLSDVPGTIVTSAVGPVEGDPFREAGFTERETLHLLRHDLSTRPEQTRHQLRPGRRTDTAKVLDIDDRSFDEFWTLDRDALMAARKATPIHRYRVATANKTIVGYAVTGRAGSMTFLQRLGVDPDHRGQGIGSDLVHDALTWAIDEGANAMLVNTQVTNDRARRLYESLGFVLSTETLVVLERKPT